MGKFAREDGLRFSIKAERRRTARSTLTRFRPALDSLEGRVMLSSIAPYDVGTLGLFTDDRILTVNTSTGTPVNTYSPSATPDAFTGWLYWQDDNFGAFSLDGTDKIMAGGDYGFTGEYGVGGSNFIQNQDLIINNLSGGSLSTYEENQFNDWETLAQFSTASLPNPPYGPIYLVVTADQTGPAGDQVGVGWFTIDGTTFSYAQGQNYYNAATSSAGVITLNGGTTYEIDVTQAVSQYLSQSPPSTSNLAFLLTPESSDMELSGVSVELDTPPPVITPTLASLPDGSGGVSLDYTVAGDLGDEMAYLDLYWSPTQSFGADATLVRDASGNPVGLTIQQTHDGPTLLTPSQLGTPPSGTQYLLAVATAVHPFGSPSTLPVVAVLPYTPPAASASPSNPSTPAAPTTGDDQTPSGPSAPTAPATPTPAPPAPTAPGTAPPTLQGGNGSTSTWGAVQATLNEYLAEINHSLDAAELAHNQGDNVLATLRVLEATGKVAEKGLEVQFVLDGAIFARGAIQSVVKKLGSLEGLVLRGINSLKALAKQITQLATSQSPPPASTVEQVAQKTSQVLSEAKELASTSKNASNLFSEEPGVGRVIAPKNPNNSIKITPRGLKHVLDRHIPSGALSSGKSLFSSGEDVSALISEAETVPPTRQAGGNFQRIVNAGKTIGIDRATGQPTNIYTVITNAAGELVTAFPGSP